MHSGRRVSRRKFLKAAGGAGLAAPWIVRASALGAGAPAPSSRLGLGMIGLGSMGMRHVEGFLQETDCRLVALSDVDAARREAGVAEVEKHYRRQGSCAAYNDFRDLLARRDVDAVCIAVPDHGHARIAVEAARAGKDIYGEKPLALTIDAGKAIVRAVRRHGTVWQTGSWQRATENFRFACELVRSGRIGRLVRVDVTIGEAPAIEPQPPMAVPEGFDYERWLGPAPWAPYTEKRCHWTFRWIFDYSGGQVTDWGAHHIDIAHWGMGMDESGPLEVSGTGEFPRTGLFDTAVRYRFDCVYPGGLVMHVASHPKEAAIKFVGEKGWVKVWRGGLETQPAALRRTTIGADEIHLRRPRGDERQGHRRDWLDCIKARSDPLVPVEIGHRSVIPCHLANIAMRLGRRIRWDPAAETIVGDEEAARFMGRAAREPWQV